MEGITYFAGVVSTKGKVAGPPRLAYISYLDYPRSHEFIVLSNPDGPSQYRLTVTETDAGECLCCGFRYRRYEFRGTDLSEIVSLMPHHVYTVMQRVRRMGSVEYGGEYFEGIPVCTCGAFCKETTPSCICSKPRTANDVAYQQRKIQDRHAVAKRKREGLWLDLIHEEMNCVCAICGKQAPYNKGAQCAECPARFCSYCDRAGRKCKTCDMLK